VKLLRIRLAEHAGFCSGVKEAVETALQESTCRGRVSTLGPLVHNEAVSAHLARHNVAAVNDPEEAAGGILLIRTHGVPPAVMEKAARLERLTVLDLTCPKVRRVQKLARMLAESGVQIVIYGDARHPEVKGIIGWAGEKAGIDVVASAEELKGLAVKPAAALIAQTTGEKAVYEEIKALFLQLCPGGKVYDTLCPETGIRQQEAVRLASEVEAMVVVGSPASANTRALAEVCRRLKPTIMVAGAGELDPEFMRKYSLIGVTAGASTPHWMIKEVVERMENEKLEMGTGFTEAGPEEAAQEAEEVETVQEKEQMEAAPEEEVAEVMQEEANPDTADRAEAEQEAVQAEEVRQEAVEEAAVEEAAVEEAAVEEAAVEETAVEETVEEEQEDAAFTGEDFDFTESLNLVQVGEQVVGKVVRAAEDEVFLDIGYKTEALLPTKEVYLQEGESLVDRFEPGQEVEVTVIDIDDQESKVVVSHKRLARDKRWQELARLLEDETTEERRVKQVVNAGMVIDLGEGIDGFMPGSLVDLRYVPDFKPFLGEKVRFKVIELNREKDKAILSRKKVIEEENLRKKEETLQSLEIGSTIPGVVRRLTDFGAFVDVGGIDGLVHVSEISWERVAHPQEVLKVGQEIEVKVLDVIPERERISLSLRRTEPDPWTKAMQELKGGEVVKGKITRLVNFGAFVELRPGVEGLVHISQIADYHVKHPSEVLHEGEEVDVKILELKPQAKRIGLSIKEVRQSNHYSNPGEADTGDGGTVTLGDVFGDLFEQETKAEGEDGSSDLPEETAGDQESEEG
jgi:(E)-4-hydroxy-3-methyl-but-2-enyl pyrophosphate reductase